MLSISSYALLFVVYCLQRLYPSKHYLHTEIRPLVTDHCSCSPQTAILLLRIDDIVSGLKKKGDGAGGAPAGAPMGGPEQ